MAAKRQDRFLERQRGAGTRQIKNIGFNLLLPGQENVFDAPLQPQKSGRSRKTPQPDLIPQRSGRSRKTPQPELLLQRSIRRTPAPEEAVLQKSLEKTPANPNPKKRPRPSAILELNEGEAIRENEGEVAAKKRKINRKPRASKAVKPSNVSGRSIAEEVQVLDSQAIIHDQDPLPGPGGRKRRKRKSIGQQSINKARSAKKSPTKSLPAVQKRGGEAKNAEVAQSVVFGTPEPPEYSRITTPAALDTEKFHVRTPIELAHGDVHTNLSKVHKSWSGTDQQRNAEPIVKGQRRGLRRHTVRELIIEATADEDAIKESQVKPKRGRKPGSKNKVRKEVTAIEEPMNEYLPGIAKPLEQVAESPRETAIEAPVSPTNRDLEKDTGKERKPRRKKRKSIGQQSLRHKRSPKGTATPKQPARDNTVNTEPASPLHDAQIPPTVKEPTDAIPDPADHEIVQLPEVAPEKKRGRPRKVDGAPPLTKPTKPPQTRAQKPKPTKPSAPKTRKPPANTIPITYYAPPTPTSPTSSTSSTTDPLSSLPAPKPSIPKTTNINAIDVLSQITLELISKHSTHLSEQAAANPDPAQCADYARQQEVVDIYAEELKERLFQLTKMLNENTALTARVKRQAVEERRLRREIKALKAEREEVGRRKEEVVGRRKEEEEVVGRRRRKEEAVKEREGRELQDMLSGIGEAVRKGWEMEASKEDGVVPG